VLVVVLAVGSEASFGLGQGLGVECFVAIEEHDKGCFASMSICKHCHSYSHSAITSWNLIWESKGASVEDNGGVGLKIALCPLKALVGCRLDGDKYHSLLLLLLLLLATAARGVAAASNESGKKFPVGISCRLRIVKKVTVLVH